MAVHAWSYALQVYLDWRLTVITTVVVIEAMGKKPLKLGPVEMEVLGLLEGDEHKSVHDVVTLLEKRGKPLAYTTVMTVMTRLFEKGLLKRTKVGRQYLYVHAKAAESFRRGLWSSVYHSLFQSSRVKPILALIDQADDLTADELSELKKYIDEKLASRRGKR